MRSRLASIPLLVALGLGAAPGAEARSAPRALTVPEIGEDDFRISWTGPDGDSRTLAYGARLAYSATRNEYLVVWQGRTQIGGRYHIWARRLSAVTGQLLGTAVRLSTAATTYDAAGVDVAWSSAQDHYLVTWVAPASGANPEVLGRRMTGAGTLVGQPFAISQATIHGDDPGGVQSPAVAYDAALDEFLVVWSQAWDLANEFQIWGRRLTGTGTVVSAPRMLSFLFGGIGRRGAFEPAVSAAGGAWVVAFEGRATSAGLAPGETEIFVQRAYPGPLADGSPGIYTDPEQRVSDVFGVGTDAGYPGFPTIARAASGQFLVAWDSNDELPGLSTSKREVWGQRLDSALVEVGANDFRISQTGADSDPGTGAARASATYHEGSNRFLVSFARGTLGAGSGVDVHGQYFNAATGAPQTPDDFVISEPWPADVEHFAYMPDAACGLTCLVVWYMQEPGNSPQEEYEIWGQRLCAYAAGDTRYCAHCGPCEPGQGDCDSDGQCRSGLTCAHNVGANYGFPASIDVCEDHCPVPLGHASRCASCGPCRWGEGDCDSNAECQTGLSCVHNVGAEFGWPAGIDVCLFPEV